MTEEDLQKYVKHLDTSDLTYERKVAIVKAVHNIMQSFVDRSFGDDPVQLALEAKERG